MIGQVRAPIKSIPAAVARGWPMATELCEYPYASGAVDNLFPGTEQVWPDTVIALLHELGYRGALAPEHLPEVFGKWKNEISMAWVAG